MTHWTATMEVRRVLEAQIEELIALLDTLDGDENLEPSLAGFDPNRMDDREADDENDEDGGDTELNGDEEDFDGGECDAPLLISGGLGL